MRLTKVPPDCVKTTFALLILFPSDAGIREALGVQKVHDTLLLKTPMGPSEKPKRVVITAVEQETLPFAHLY